jgi:hypothetical protein
VLTADKAGVLSPTQAIDELVDAFSKALKNLFVLLDVEKDRHEIDTRILLSELYETRGKLTRQGGNLRRMDAIDLGKAVAYGLIDKAEADEELARRRREFPQTLNIAGPARGGSNVGGSMPCAYDGCWTAIAASSETFPFCSAHASAPSRLGVPWLTALEL